MRDRVSGSESFFCTLYDYFCLSSLFYIYNYLLSGHYGDMSKDEHIELLQMKDEEIDGMKNEILKEQQVNSHVHMVQEKEILDKDRAITFLNKQLTIKQKEIDCLRKLNKKVACYQ